MRVAILGSRGIPAEFGGFETFAEHLAIGLVQRGIEVTVFCEDSQQYQAATYKGVSLVHIRTPRIVGLRSIWFDCISLLRTLRGYDAVYMLGYNAAFAFIVPWLLRTRLWVNMDGLEWQRAKWGPGAKLFLRLMERLAVWWSWGVVADAEGIRSHIRQHYRRNHRLVMIPYGAERIARPPASTALTALGLQPRSYYLVVCRLEPENHVLEVINGFAASWTNKMLVVLGDHTVATPYVRSLLAINDPRIRFAGAIYDSPTVQALRYHCAAYLHGHSVGGTNPSLLESMACDNLIIAHDNVFTREVTRERARFFTSAADVTEIISSLETDDREPESATHYGDLLDDCYNWDAVTEKHLDTFLTLR